MILHPADVAQHLGERARALENGSDVVVPLGTPRNEIARSPAAARIGELATREGLFCFHFERRGHLPLPLDWVPEHAPELAAPPEWDAGILPERKYQSFRHDLLLGSFHPHHRAKWSTHELCHGLVGFAWAPDATPLFHATAGRLAELLPVALWYFFDEAFLRRCPEHHGDGALFRTFCPACERAAAASSDDDGAEERIAAGLVFVDRELAAIDKTRRSGRPHPHRWATLDLCSDGIAYAHAHAERLGSRTFHRFAERFLGGPERCDTLDGLQARVQAVLSSLLSDAPLAPMAVSPLHGRWRWTLQDVAWRLHQVEALLGTDLGELLDPIASAHAKTADARQDPSATSALQHARQAYADRAQDDWPHPDDVFALGYAVAGLPDGTDLVAWGLREVLPLTHAALDDRFEDLVTATELASPWVRGHAAKRVADTMRRDHPGPLSDLAAWEAAVATTTRTGTVRLVGASSRSSWTLGPNVTLLTASHDVLELAHGVDAGTLTTPRGCFESLNGPSGSPVTKRSSSWIVARDAAGEMLVLDLAPEVADVLSRGDFSSSELDHESFEMLTELGVVHPTRWALRAGDSDEMADRAQT